MTDTPIRVQTLGNFQIWRDEQPITDFGSDEAECLLKILISYGAVVVPTGELIANLRGSGKLNMHEPERGLTLLVDDLRHSLEPSLSQAEDSAFILRRDGGYVFDVSQGVRIDVDELDHLLDQGREQQAQGADAAAIQTYEQAIALYQGEYLPQNRSDNWSVPLRNHAQSQYARVLNRLSDLYAKHGQFEAAIQTSQHSLQIDSYHESSHRRLMRYHCCAGDREAALKVYATWAKLKGEFFNEEPEAKTQALYAAIMAGEVVDCLEQKDAVKGEKGHDGG